MGVEAFNSSKIVHSLDYYASDAVLSSTRLFSEYPEPLLRLATVCYILFMVIGIPGNIITICALAQYKKIQNASAIFIINLSISDLSFCSLILPQMLCGFITKSWILGKTMCRLFPLLKYTLTAVTIFSLIAITVCRYVLIVHPQYYYKLYNKKNIKIMITAIWVSAFAIFVPSLLEIWGRYSLDPLVGFCSLVPDERNQSPKKILVVFAFLFPFAVMVLCYAHIIRIVKEKRKKIHQQCNKNNEEDSIVETSNVEIGNYSTESRQTFLVEGQTLEESPSRNSFQLKNDVTKFSRNLQSAFKKLSKKKCLPTKRDQKLQTMIVIIISCFCICRLPIMMTKALYSKLSSYPTLIIACYLLKHSTICLNPVIYVVISNEYRQAYKSLVKSIFERR